MVCQNAGTENFYDKLSRCDESLLNDQFELHIHLLSGPCLLYNEVVSTPYLELNFPTCKRKNKANEN